MSEWLIAFCARFVTTPERFQVIELPAMAYICRCFYHPWGDKVGDIHGYFGMYFTAQSWEGDIAGYLGVYFTAQSQGEDIVIVLE